MSDLKKMDGHGSLGWCFAAHLGRETTGVSAVEFAVCLPVLLIMGMYGIEIAHMSTVNMEVSQMAMSVADNASRLGQTDNSSVTPTVTETDIDSIMKGALEQGATFDFEDNGRVILTSLEKDSATGKQYIHWQRCVGDLPRTSSYGNATSQNGLAGSALPGMGKVGSIITASAGKSVMYVEVYYHYDGLFNDMFGDNMVFKHEAAFQTRDDRNLTPGVTGSGGSSHCS